MAAWDILFTREGRQQDDVPEVDLKRMLKSGELRPEDCIRRAGEAKWRQVAELKGGAKAAVAAAPAAAAEIARTEPMPVVVATETPAPAAANDFGPGALSFDDEDELAVDFADHSHQENLDMTPMVDVVLLLLLFFMVTASYATQKILNMTKPDAKQTKGARVNLADIAKENVMVEIDRRNQIFIDTEPVKGRESVRNMVARAAKENNKTKAIVVAEGESQHGTSVRVLDGIREAGISQIQYQVKSDD